TSKPAKLDVNGTWLDEKGRSWEIDTNEGYMTLSTETGVKFEGNWTPPTFALIHDLTFAETRKDLPVPIRQKIVGERTVIDGKVAPDGESIDVDFVEKDPKWDYYPDTGKYVILEMRDAHKSYRLTRPAEIHISHIYVDYTEAEEHNRQL